MDSQVSARRARRGVLIITCGRDEHGRIYRGGVREALRSADRVRKKRRSSPCDGCPCGTALPRTWLMLAIELARCHRRCHMGHHAMCRGSDTSTAVLCIVYTRVITITGISSADSASARVRGPGGGSRVAGAGPAARCRLPRTRRSDPRGSGCGLELSIYSRGVYVSAVRCDARWRDARFRSGSSFGCRRGFVTLRKPSCPVNSAVSGLSR